MSRKTNTALKKQADIFFALSDQTRLSLVQQLGQQNSQSITQLSAKSKITRQAITKHLRVLENVGLVHSLKLGRESLYQFDPLPLKEAVEALKNVAEQWDNNLHRLKTFIEG